MPLESSQSEYFKMIGRSTNGIAPVAWERPLPAQFYAGAEEGELPDLVGCQLSSCIISMIARCSASR